MNKLTFLTILILSFVFSVSLYSQGEFSLQVGTSFPMGDFGDRDMQNLNSGRAGTGFGVGVKYIYPVTDFGLGLYGGISVTGNPYSSVAKNYTREYYPKSEITFPVYYTIPVSLGIDYTLDASERISIFGQSGVSLSLLKRSKSTIKQIGDEDENARTAWSTNIGFTIGGGLVFFDKYELSLKYFGLGLHNIKGELEYGSYPSTDHYLFEIDDYQNVSLLLVSLGIRM